MMVAIMPPAANVSLVHDARAVHDTATLLFRDFAAAGKPSWTLAVVTPAADSGAATIPGAEIDEKTGTVVHRSGAQASVKKAGTWKAISAAPSAEHRGGTYSWVQPMEFHQRGTTPEDYYSPFADGGTIVFRYQPGAAGEDQFHSVRLVFPDWGFDVTAASNFVEGHPGLLENGEQLAPEITRLRQLLDDKNKLLVVEAFRELAEGAHLDPNLALEHLTRAEAPLDAILSYLMLSSRDDDLAEKVNATIYATRDEKKLQSIALGAYSALLFRSQDPRILARSKTALQHVRSMVEKTRIPPKNSYLDLILSTAGLP